MRRLTVRDTKVQHLSFTTFAGEHVLQQRWAITIVFAFLIPVLEQHFASLHGLLDVWVHAERGSTVEITTGFECLSHGLAVRHVS